MNSYEIIDISNSNPDISIAMLAYNQEDYITQAIESVLMQKTRYNYKIVIAEDYSTDNTRAIVLKYQKKYPDKIKLILQNHNVGPNKNNADLLSNLEGKYIAALEGDDYWTDESKLQKQVDFLEQNPEYVLCFHKVNIQKLDNEIVEDFITKVPEDHEHLTSLAKYGNYIHTPSVVFRNVIDTFPSEFSQSPIGDYFLYFILAQYGKMKYIEETMAVYRYGSGFYSHLEYSAKFKKWGRTLVLISSFNRNEEIKPILQKKLFDLFNLNDDIEIKPKKNKSKFRQSVNLLKLFIPPVFLIVKRKIFNPRYGSK